MSNSSPGLQFLTSAISSRIMELTTQTAEVEEVLKGEIEKAVNTGFLISSSKHIENLEKISTVLKANSDNGDIKTCSEVLDKIIINIRGELK